MTQKDCNPNNPEVSFPGYTVWKPQHCCCCTLEEIPALDQRFIGHWEIRPILPFGVLLVSFASFIFLTCFLLPNFDLEGYIAIPLSLMFYLLFITSYVRIIIDGPGYFPFYWAAQSMNIAPPPKLDDHLTDFDDNPSGIISNEEQHKWAKLQRRPPRSILSKTARRMVIRPDHFCLWASSWIGKRNHKFFILFNFYGILYMTIFDVYAIRYEVLIYKGQMTIFISVLTVLALIDVIALLVFLSFLITQIFDASKNRTSWELWNNIDSKKYDKGKVGNFEEIFGPKNKWPIWFCPFSPWKGITNEEIVNGYESYYCTV